MKTCTYCGVELEQNMNFCPLCGEPVMDEGSDQLEYIKVRKREQEQKLLTDYQKLTRKQKRNLFWQISGIVLISGVFITLILDFLGNNNITWSRYSITACAVLFINTTLISFLNKKILLLLTGSFVSTSALLVLFDMFDSTIGWGVKLGIPLLLAAYIIVYILITLIRMAENKGLNIIAYSMLAAGMLSLCADGIISLYTANQFSVEWSLITMASVIPVAALFLYIHFRLRKGTNLRRFFHI